MSQLVSFGSRVLGALCLILATSLAQVQSTSPTDRPSVTQVIGDARISLQSRIRLKPKYQVKEQDKVTFSPGLDRSMIIVKFHDGTRVYPGNPQDLREADADLKTLRARLDGLAPRGNYDIYDLALLKRQGLSQGEILRDIDQFRNIVDVPELVHWGRVFRQPYNVLTNMRRNTELVTKTQASDMGTYLWFRFKKGTRAEQIATQILALDSIEHAYLAPIPEVPQDIPPATPNFQTAATNASGFSQGYLAPAPAGINAQFAWTIPGGNGTGMTVADVEWGWRIEHEDLPPLAFTSGVTNLSDRDHGTASLSVMVAPNNGYGITGIAFGAAAGVSSSTRTLYFTDIGDAIFSANIRMNAGDVILIEHHAQRGLGQENCTACIRNGAASSSCGLVAIEYWHHIFDAIAAASATGGYCC